jgi:hypothetical protein
LTVSALAQSAKILEQTRAYKSGSIVFDIETAPLPVQVVRERVAPFTPPPHPGQFDQSKVAVGNLKDPAKIAAKIAEAEQKHSTLVENYAQDCANAVIAGHALFIVWFFMIFKLSKEFV